jgi:hypothetical protein
LPMAASASEGSAVGNRPFTAEADLEIVQVSFLALRSQVLSLGLGLAKAKADNSLAEVKLVEANVALEEAKASIKDAEAELDSVKQVLEFIGDDLGYDERARDLKSSTSSLFCQFPRSTAFDKNASRQYFDSLPNSRVKSMEAEELEQYAAGWTHPSPTMDELAVKHPELYERVPDMADTEEHPPWSLLSMGEPEPANRGGPRPSRAGEVDGGDSEVIQGSTRFAGPTRVGAPRRLQGSRMVPKSSASRPKPKYAGAAPSSAHANQHPRGSAGRLGVRSFTAAPWAGNAVSPTVGTGGGKGHAPGTLGKPGKCRLRKTASH